MPSEPERKRKAKQTRKGKGATARAQATAKESADAAAVKAFAAERGLTVDSVVAWLWCRKLQEAFEEQEIWRASAAFGSFRTARSIAAKGTASASSSTSRGETRFISMNGPF